jgi:hypothetical protein
MKTEEVTLWISLQFVSFPRISLAPATSDEITTLAVNRSDLLPKIRAEVYMNIAF